MKLGLRVMFVIQLLRERAHGARALDTVPFAR